MFWLLRPRSIFSDPQPKIAAGYQGLLYLAENIAFLPGLLPIEPLFAVNWSLSYEWWFYASATLMFSVLGLSALPKAGRIGLILGLAGALITLSALDLPNVPIRGLPSIRRNVAGRISRQVAWRYLRPIGLRLFRGRNVCADRMGDLAAAGHWFWRIVR